MEFRKRDSWHMIWNQIGCGVVGARNASQTRVLAGVTDRKKVQATKDIVKRARRLGRSLPFDLIVAMTSIAILEAGMRTEGMIKFITMPVRK